MKNVLLCLTCLLLLSSIPSAAFGAAPKPADFQYSSAVKGQIKNKTMYQVVLSAEILQKCSLTNCDDLRLMDSNSREIPYVIINNYYKETVESYPLEIINYKDNSHLAVITAKLPNNYKPISIIKLEIPEHDFNKKVTLHGSLDMKNWTLLSEDNIYDFYSQVDLRKTEIKFDKSDRCFYRIQLIEKEPSAFSGETVRLKYKNLDFSAGNIKNKKIRINKILGQTTLKTYEPAVEDEIVFTGFSSDIDEEGNTVIILKTNLPFDRVYFDTSNQFFYRDVIIYSSGTGEKTSYSLLSRDVIYRFSLTDSYETKNYIDHPVSKQRFYKFVIKNEDNPPVIVRNIKFKWVRKNLYFIGLNDSEKYTLYFGSQLFNNPHYDLSNFIHQDNWFNHKFEKLEISQITENPAYKPALPKDKQKRVEKTFLIAIVIILVVGISYWVYALIKKTSTQRKDYK